MYGSQLLGINFNVMGIAREKIFKEINHIWAWWISLSGDQDPSRKLSFSRLNSKFHVTVLIQSAQSLHLTNIHAAAEIWVTFVKAQRMTLASDTQKSSSIYLLNGHIKIFKKYFVAFSNIKPSRKQVWLFCKKFKVNEGHTWISLINLECQSLYPV